MSELPDGIEPAPIPEPMDSALGIVLDARGGVLLGKRARTSRFMPGHLAFPGGRLEAADESFEHCASRELMEETGLRIPVEAWHDAGERTTPPFFPFRFRTRFFVAALPDGEAIPAVPPAPAEIETLELMDPAPVLAGWEAGRLLVPPPLLPILRAMAAEPGSDPRRLAQRIRRLNADEQPAPRIEFTPGVWALPVRSRTLPPASCTNVWIPGGRSFVVIDPGSDDPDENETLLAVIARRVATGSRALAVVLTHHHRDHVGGAHEIARALGIPIRARAETLARIPRAAGAATEPIEDGETLDLDGMTLRAMLTPGHAPGHLVFHDEARRVLIAGDLVSGLSTILVGLDDGDMDQYLASLARAAALEPATVLPGHGPPLPGRALAAALSHREEREARIVAALGASPRALAAIAEEAYADTPAAPAFLRERQARAHLERLERHGRAAREDAPGTRWRAS